MVDLAKIRKKAKKGAEGRAQSAGEPAPEAAASVPTAIAEPPALGEPAAAEVSLPAVPRPAEEVTDPPMEPAAATKLDRFKEQAGKRRVTRIEQVDQTGEQRLELLTFAIAGEQYAVDIERIVEIVTPRPVTRIPNADPSVLGITSLRGTIVTLVDVRRKLRHAPLHSTGEETRIVVIELQRETVGFTVDRVLRVVKIGPSEVEPHPVVHSTELEDSIRGVFRTSGALTILLDLDKLLDHS